MVVGSTYIDLLPGQPEHLWFVTTKPDASDTVVVFSLTSMQPWIQDLACVLGPSDHPWIRHDSVVAFQHGRAVRASGLAAAIAAGSTVRPRDPASDGLMAKIRLAACVSIYTPNRLKKWIRVCDWTSSEATRQ